MPLLALSIGMAAGEDEKTAWKIGNRLLRYVSRRMDDLPKRGELTMNDGRLQKVKPVPWVTRVNDQIENKQLDLSRIGQRGPKSDPEYAVDADAAAQRALQQIVYVRRRLVQLERFGLKPLAA